MFLGFVAALEVPGTITPAYYRAAVLACLKELILENEFLTIMAMAMVFQAMGVVICYDITDKVPVFTQTSLRGRQACSSPSVSN